MCTFNETPAFPSTERLLRGRVAVTACPGQDECGLCAAACGFGALKKPGRMPAVDFAACIGCAACVKVCPRCNMRLIDGSRDEAQITVKCRLADLPEMDEVVSIFDENGNEIGRGIAIQAYPLPDGRFGIARFRTDKALLERAASAKKQTAAE